MYPTAETARKQTEYDKEFWFNVCSDYLEQSKAAQTEGCKLTKRAFIRTHAVLTLQNEAAFSKHFGKFVKGYLRPSTAKRHRKRRLPPSEEKSATGFAGNAAGATGDQGQGDDEDINVPMNDQVSGGEGGLTQVPLNGSRFTNQEPQEVVYLPSAYAKLLGEDEKTGSRLTCVVNGATMSVEVLYVSMKGSIVYEDGDILLGLTCAPTSRWFRDVLAREIETAGDGRKESVSRALCRLEGRSILLPEYWEIPSTKNEMILKAVRFKKADVQGSALTDWLQRIVTATVAVLDLTRAIFDEISAQLEAHIRSALYPQARLFESDIVTGTNEWSKLRHDSFPASRQKYADFVGEIGCFNSSSKPQSIFENDRVFQVKASTGSVWFQHFDGRGKTVDPRLFSKYERLNACRRDTRAASKKKRPALHLKLPAVADVARDPLQVLVEEATKRLIDDENLASKVSGDLSPDIAVVGKLSSGNTVVIESEKIKAYEMAVANSRQTGNTTRTDGVAQMGSSSFDRRQAGLSHQTETEESIADGDRKSAGRVRDASVSASMDKATDKTDGELSVDFEPAPSLATISTSAVARRRTEYNQEFWFNVFTEYQQQELAARPENFTRRDYIRNHPDLTLQHEHAFSKKWKKFQEGRVQPSQAMRERKATIKWPKAEDAMVRVLSMPVYKNIPMAKKQMLARMVGDETGKSAAFKASIGWVKGVLKRNAEKIAAAADQEEEESGVAKKARHTDADGGAEESLTGNDRNRAAATATSDDIAVDTDSAITENRTMLTQNTAVFGSVDNIQLNDDIELDDHFGYQSQDPAKMIEEALRIYAQGSDLRFPLVVFRQALDILLETPDHNKLDVARLCNNIGLLLQDQGDMDAAMTHYQRALGIQHHLDATSSCYRGEVPQTKRSDLKAVMANYQLAWGTTENLSAEVLANICSSYDVESLQQTQDIVGKEISRNRLELDSLTVASTYNYIGSVQKDQGDLAVAMPNYQRALAIRERFAPDSLDVAQSYNNIGALQKDQGDLNAAMANYQRALVIQERLAPNSLNVATSYSNIGSLEKDRGALNDAMENFQQALAIRERLAAPDSLAVATAYGNIGSLQQDQGSIDAAMANFQRALTIQERLAPDSLAVATTCGNIGSLQQDQGSMDAAMANFQRALTIQERLAPESLAVATSYNNMGSLQQDLGAFDASMANYRRALAKQECLAPDSLAVATTCVNIGSLQQDLGALDASMANYQRALAIQERLVPDSLTAAATYNSIGVLQRQRGDLDSAMPNFERALAIEERLAPDSLTIAAVYNNLGSLQQANFDLEAAFVTLSKGLEILERLAPDSLAVATSYNNIGAWQQEQGDYDKARSSYQRALEIRKKLTLNSLGVAESYHNMGSLLEACGDTTRASASYHRALRIGERVAPNAVIVQKIKKTIDSFVATTLDF